jgi:hypothetical protein
MRKSRSTTSKLSRFLRDGVFVRFETKFERGYVRGYVLDVGPRFFLLSQVSDRVRLDGFGCYRVDDVKNLTPDPYANFAEAALRKFRIARPKKPKVSVSKIEELLSSANKSFPLVAIHRAKKDPHACWIGRIEEITRTHVALREIGPDAKWDPGPTKYRLSEITSVEFGGEYERALHLVGGKPK